MIRHVHTWRCGPWEIPLEAPLIMGIVNVTPDSFSDGGAYTDVGTAVEHALDLVEQGAAIIDIGGESTRPGASDVPVDEETARVVPVVRRLAAQGVVVSIDTRNAAVADAALSAGAVIVNDVTGFSDPDMVRIAAESDAGLVVMHSLGDPRTMGGLARYDDVVGEVEEWLIQRAAVLESAGVAPDRICLDAGLGFAKVTEHNFAILAETGRFAALGYPYLVGISRKRSIGEVTGIEQPLERDPGSIAAALLAAERGAHIVRVHDVGGTAQALAVLHAFETKEIR